MILRNIPLTDFALAIAGYNTFGEFISSDSSSAKLVNVVMTNFLFGIALKEVSRRFTAEDVKDYKVKKKAGEDLQDNRIFITIMKKINDEKFMKKHGEAISCFLEETILTSLAAGTVGAFEGTLALKKHSQKINMKA